MNKLPDHIERTLEGLPAPARAWALAKAASETADDLSMKEQEAEIARVTADDPEPNTKEPGLSREEFRKRLNESLQWHERNHERLAPIAAPIIAKHKVHELDRFYKEAEKNMVDWAEACLKRRYKDHEERFAPAFEAYREKRIFGDMRERFLKICFNCPG